MQSLSTFDHKCSAQADDVMMRLTGLFSSKLTAGFSKNPTAGCFVNKFSGLALFVGVNKRPIKRVILSLQVFFVVYLRHGLLSLWLETGKSKPAMNA